MKRAILVAMVLGAILMALSPIRAKEEIFLEPTAEEWAKMTPADREIARKKVEKKWALQREASSRYQQDQKDGVCHVHKEKMIARTVKIPVGLPKPSSRPPIPRAVLGKYLTASAEKFPNAIETVSGSCIPPPDGRTTETIHVCASCLAARRQVEADLGIVK